jgi:hypothetical protein
MIANKPVGSDQCTRGLEFQSPHAAKYRKKNKLEAPIAVWNEQVAPWKDNVTDDLVSPVYTPNDSTVSESLQTARTVESAVIAVAFTDDICGGPILLERQMPL